MTEAHTIPHFALPKFEEAIAKMNRKAARFGVAPITVTKLGETEIELTHYWKVFTGDGTEERSRKVKTPATIVSVVGSTPTVGDYSFIARIEYLGDGESMLFHTVPGSEHKVDERFRTLRPFVCEHCNAARIRRDTFVVCNNATGEQKQVGRQCLNDFTGLMGVKDVLAKAAMLSTYSKIYADMEEYCGGHGYFQDKVDTLSALTLTSAYIEMYGWRAKSSCMEGETPTASHVSSHFTTGIKFSDDEKKEMARAWALAESNPLHKERAAKVMAWVKGELAARAKSDYELNLVTLVSKELAETRHTGLVCSAVSAYQRAMNQAVEYAKKRESLKGSKPVGEVGKRMKGVKATVNFLRSMESAWGASTMVKFVTEDGNLLTWFASGDRDFTVGEALVIDATVKKHSEYNGIQETQVSRVKVKENA